jgi:hypothetical protein
MRSLVVGFAVVSMAFIMFSGATGQEKGKEVTVKGTITCAKCDLQVEKKCATVIVTKEKDKDVTIYFDTESNKKYHGDTCTEPKKGSVTGVVSTKDDKKTITVSKDGVKYDK